MPLTPSCFPTTLITLGTSLCVSEDRTATTLFVLVMAELVGAQGSGSGQLVVPLETQG